MIPRNLDPLLRRSATWYPVVTVTGPRQSGKTTLCKATFPSHTYVSLEPVDQRERARTDPRGFLQDCEDGAILDEVQHVPDLLGYIQERVDEDPRPGRFILTGSQNFSLSRALSQSLAGRTAVLTLLPPSHDEIQRFASAPTTLDEALLAGSFPRIHDRQIPAQRWLADYVTTYVERDVRDILNVGDLQAFSTFVRLCAGQSGGELNLSRLGADAGVSHNTARSWLSVLETSYLFVRVPPWSRNLRKRLVKAPKLHIADSGLHCHLLGIRSVDQLRHHPLRGAIFESWMAMEILKNRIHAGLSPDLAHYRESRGLEVDLLVEGSESLTLVEAKAGATVHPDFVAPLGQLARLLEEANESRAIRRRLCHGGNRTGTIGGTELIPWSAIASADWQS
ncbi:MAG: ATP-binding protein [Planctomycetes bacterium]|nr:ATP-binding protein [Planctomycetota bacterium]